MPAGGASCVSACICPPYKIIPRHEIDPAKVEKIKAAVKAGKDMPNPVVVSLGNSEYMPIDGHHRLAVEPQGYHLAWIIGAKVYDRLCMVHDNPEEYILCGDQLAMEVAGNN